MRVTMSHIPPFDYVVGFGIVGTLASVIDMNEILRMMILMATLIGIIIKTWEQIKKSEFFLNDIKEIWKKIKKK
jgi:hypothetical protein